MATAREPNEAPPSEGQFMDNGVDRAGGASIRRRARPWCLVIALTLASVACASQTDGAGGEASAAPDDAETNSAVVLPTPTSEGPDVYPEGSALRLFRGDRRFSTLVGIIEQGQVGAALSILSRPHHAATIIAPTDEAFRRLSPELLRAILDDRVVGRVVRNHVISDPRTSLELEGAAEMQTLGVAVAISRAGDDLRVAGVPLEEKDIEVGPTIIHIVDNLILPCHDAYLTEELAPHYARVCGGQPD